MAADFPLPSPSERRAVVQRWHRRSRLIRSLRIVLPALMAVILSGMTGLVVWRSITDNSAPPKDGHTSIRLINARFVGRVEDGRGFMLGARSAVRDERDYQKVTLAEPMFTVGAETAQPSRILAKSGVYNERDKLLHLLGNVRIDDGQGLRFASETATVDMRTGKLVGDEGVQGDGPLGQVTAKSYSVDRDGDRMVLRGGVRARIEGQ